MLGARDSHTGGTTGDETVLLEHTAAPKQPICRVFVRSAPHKYPPTQPIPTNGGAHNSTHLRRSKSGLDHASALNTCRQAGITVQRPQDAPRTRGSRHVRFGTHELPAVLDQPSSAAMRRCQGGRMP